MGAVSGRFEPRGILGAVNGKHVVDWSRRVLPEETKDDRHVAVGPFVASINRAPISNTQGHGICAVRECQILDALVDA